MQYQLLTLALVAAAYATPQGPNAPITIISTLPSATGTGFLPSANGTAVSTGLIPGTGTGANGTAFPTGGSPGTTVLATTGLTSITGTVPSTTGTGGSAAASPTSSTGGASLPTAIVGLGFAGVAGLAGLLVL